MIRNRLRSESVVLFELMKKPNCPGAETSYSMYHFTGFWWWWEAAVVSAPALQYSAVR